MSRVSWPLPSSEPQRSKQTTGPCTASIETSSSRSRQPCGATLRPATPRVHQIMNLRQPRVESGSRYNKRTPAMQPCVAIHKTKTHPRRLPSLCHEPKMRELQYLTGPRAPRRKQTVHLLWCQEILQRSSWAAPCPQYPQSGLTRIYRSCGGGASIPHCWDNSCRYASPRANHEHIHARLHEQVSAASLCVEPISRPRLPVPNPVVQVLM